MADKPPPGDREASAGEPIEVEEPPAPQEVRFIGPATAAVLAEAPFDAAAILAKDVSYEMLIDAGVNPGVAGRLRREHSLSWSMARTRGADLRRRSAQIRGLRSDERSWITASGTQGAGETGATGAASDGSGIDIDAELAWRERSRPTPVSALRGVDAGAAEALADAGAATVRALAVAEPEILAAELDLPVEQVAEWHAAARDRSESV